jgi:hypothetical protein
MYAQELALSRAAFAAQRYAAAYHALAAAMHSAIDLGDEGRLAEVEACAHEQISWIDAHDPTHHLSTQSSLARGAHNLWETLAQESKMRRMMLEHARTLHLS